MFPQTSSQFPSSPPPPSTSSNNNNNNNNNNKISPAVLFIIVILAVIFFISGLLHLLVRFLMKKNPSGRSNNGGYPPPPAPPDTASDALQRQLQQLFHLHDSGLDQAFIDALPVFLYREVVGPKEPFDCAVCLCEFAGDDHLRLLPLCGHAFHLNCIDTWLLSNSTCPLCRGALFVQGLAFENPVFDFEDQREEEEEKEIAGESTRVFPVRLGKFRRLSDAGEVAIDVINTEVDEHVHADVRRREVGESSSSNLDARRCYSLGSYQYVVGNANLRVSLPGLKIVREKKLSGSSNSDGAEDGGGKKIGATSRGDSFSTSKIWMWPNKKGKLPPSNVDQSLPWMAGKFNGG
ncbi:Zinc finger RING/FYVE/PHD-type protein [Dioscorea alata]|uniref:Zinc finger RING/FYVE/PHD-type protein n=1 Tax=Dioscorea alata TaxID=55571 RepID=A0ACB7WL55_DIOAL|nr:Zinc finger RING/FYVE/PHD-type protein [Dioscorea alata]